MEKRKMLKPTLIRQVAQQDEDSRGHQDDIRAQVFIEIAIERIACAQQQVCTCQGDQQRRCINYQGDFLQPGVIAIVLK